MKSIAQIAKEKGIIRRREDAPIEDALSQEEVNYYINETPYPYNFPYKEGDIVFVKEFAYHNGIKGKNHMFVIIEEEYAISVEYFCFLISSQLKKIYYSDNIFLPRTEQNKLIKDSIVKTNIIYQFKKDEIDKKIGEVTKEELNNYKKVFYDIYAK